MAQYRLSIEGPLWPSLRKRHDATRRTHLGAINLAWEAMYDALDGMALRDRQCALDARAVVQHWDVNRYPTKRGQFVRHEIGDFIFTLTREA